MFGFDSLECHGDLINAQCFDLKNHVSEVCRFREVDRSLAVVDYRRR